jgi:ribosomal protein S18 acetylase RimI-like enzyme
MDVRQFSRNDFDDLLTLVANNAAERPTGHTYLMTSDVAWQFPGSAPKDNIRLWMDRRGLSAYAWFQPPDTLKFDIRSDIDDYGFVVTEILDWVELRRALFPASYPFFIDLDSMDEWAEAVLNPASYSSSRHRYITTSALETDDQRIGLLREKGFRSTRHFEPILTCDLSEVQIPHTPEMFTVRCVKDTEFEARVALHSAAWAPASGFNMDQYRKVRAISQVFDPDLDIVAVDSDGTFASYTIAWKDPVSLIGSFEPFGTHPDYRGTGVSRAVIGEGFRRMVVNGMQSARVYTAGFNHQAAKLYESCGFTQVDMNRTLIKRI